MQPVWIGLFAQDGGAVIRCKGCLDCVRVIEEIQHECIMLLRVSPVEAGEGLHSFDIGEGLIHIHGMQKRFIIAGLEFVCHHQKSIRIFPETIRDDVAGKSV